MNNRIFCVRSVVAGCVALLLLLLLLVFAGGSVLCSPHLTHCVLRTVCASWLAMLARTEVISGQRIKELNRK